MEQRISPITPPMHTAGIDPACVPGLTPPSPAEAEDAAPEQAAEHPPENAAPEESADAEAEPEEEPEEEAEPEEEEEVDGPVFEVSDRRSSIIADRTGITFRLDEEEAEFDWDEIGAVEVDTPRFGRRFTVRVYTTTRRWYETDVEASARRLVKEWMAGLDTVLDAYFEDDGPVAVAEAAAPLRRQDDDVSDDRHQGRL